VGSRAHAVEVRFNDGSVLKLTLLHESLEVATRYGKLVVPCGEIHKIDFGLRYPDGVLKEIDVAIEQLGHSDYRKREAASAELLRLGELAYPAARLAARSGNAEVARRAGKIVEELERRIPEEHLDLKPNDTIHTIDFTISGRLQLSALQAHSPYLGEVQVKLTDARGLRWLATPGETAFTLDAAKHGLPAANWFDTGLELSGGSLSIRASGQVDLYPYGGERGAYLASPDGARPGGRPTPFPSGALLGRLGANGREFVIGAKFDGTPPGAGRLYLRLEASPWAVVPSGSYSVRVAVNR
jgi:hypothetical protein